MSSLNKFIFTGRIGQDPAIIGSGDRAAAKFSVATKDGWGQKEKTNWHACIVYGKLRDWVIEQVKKGMLVSVVARVDYTKKGDKIYTNIVVSELEIIDWNNAEVKVGGTNPADIDESYTVGDDANDDAPF